MPLAGRSRRRKTGAWRREPSFKLGNLPLPGLAVCERFSPLAGGGRCGDPRGSNSIHLSQLNCSVCQVLALCKPRAVPRALATGFGRWSGAALPSLRAHKPILPDAIHRDQAGVILQNLAFAARNNPKLFPSRTLRNLFLATPIQSGSSRVSSRTGACGRSLPHPAPGK